jgi:L-fuculose-phosphate aldolase
MMESERRQIADFGRRLISAGLTTGTGGNLSIVDRGRSAVAISPSGVAYETMTPEDVVVMDIDGHVRHGRRKPSSEWPFHLALYRKRPDFNAVVHTHSIYATTLACLHWDIPAVHYLVAFSGKKVPCAPYATFGSDELARCVSEAMTETNAALMANHGLAAAGKDLPAAFAVAEQIELVARIYYQARCAGTPEILPEAEMTRVITKFGGYGA